MMIKRCFLLTTVLLTIFLGGCASPKYNAKPITSDHQNKNIQVVIVNDENTREGFQKAMESWLSKNNYKYTISSDGAQHNLDSLTLEYEGKWGWDLAIYLNDAYIEAFKNGQRVGKVDYKAPNSLSTSKFGKAEQRIGYMMSILFGEMTKDSANKLIN